MKRSVVLHVGFACALCGCGQPATQWIDKAVHAFNAGKYDSASVYCDQWLATDPTSCMAWQMKGRVLAAAGSEPDALKAFDRALAIDPNCPRVREYRGIVRAHLGDAEGGRQDLAAAVGVQPDNDELRSIYANLLTRMGRYSAAAPQYDTVLLHQPSNTQCMVYKANALRRSGKADMALTTIDRSLQLDGSDGFAFDIRGFCLLDLDRLDEAIVAFTTAIERYASAGEREMEAYSYNNRGYVKYRKGDLTGAMEDMEASDRRKPGNAYVHRNKALVLLKQGDRALACAEFEQAAALGHTSEYGGEVEDLIKSNCP